MQPAEGLMLRLRRRVEIWIPHSEGCRVLGFRPEFDFQQIWGGQLPPYLSNFATHSNWLQYVRNAYSTWLTCREVNIEQPNEPNGLLSRNRRVAHVWNHVRLISELKRAWERTKSGLEFYTNGVQLLWQDLGDAVVRLQFWHIGGMVTMVASLLHSMLPTFVI